MVQAGRLGMRPRKPLVDGATAKLANPAIAGEDLAAVNELVLAAVERDTGDVSLTRAAGRTEAPFLVALLDDGGLAALAGDDMLGRRGVLLGDPFFLRHCLIAPPFGSIRTAPARTEASGPVRLIDQDPAPLAQARRSR